MEFFILLLDLVITGVFYLIPIIILRIVVFKKGTTRKNAIMACLASAIISHLLCNGVCYLISGYMPGASTFAWLWIIINYNILSNKKLEKEEDKKKFYTIIIIALSLFIITIISIVILYCSEYGITPNVDLRRAIL